MCLCLITNQKPKERLSFRQQSIRDAGGGPASSDLSAANEQLVCVCATVLCGDNQEGDTDVLMEHGLVFNQTLEDGGSYHRGASKSEQTGVFHEFVSVSASDMSFMFSWE